MSGRLIPWGHSGNQPSAYGADTTRADSFDPFGPALKRGNAFQTFIDIAAVLFGFLVVSIIGLAVIYAFAVCLFLSVT